MSGVLVRYFGRREESLGAQMIILTSARIVGFFATFAIPLLLVRIFDQAQFGTYKQAFLVVGSAVPILTLGLNASLYYFVPRDDGEGTRFILHTQALTSAAALVAALVIALRPELLGSVLADDAMRTLLPLVGILIFLSTPGEMFSTLPVLDRRPTLAAYALAASDLSRALSMISAALLVGTVTAILWAGIANALLRLLFIVVYLRVRVREPVRGWSVPDLRMQIRYAAPFAVAVLLEIGLMRFHEYYVAAHESATEYAVYAVGVFQLPLIGLLVDSVIDVVIVRMAAAFKVGDRAVMRQVWSLAVGRLASILLPCWILAELTATNLIVVLFGEAYIGAVPVFRVFVASLLLWMVIDHAILRATGDTGAIVGANAVGIVVSVGATFAIGRYSVPMAAVTGYLLGLAAMRGVGLACVASRLALRWRDLLPGRDLASAAIAALIAAVPTALVQRIGLPPLIALLAAGAVYGSAYILVALRLGVFPEEYVRGLIVRFAPLPTRS